MKRCRTVAVLLLTVSGVSIVLGGWTDWTEWSVCSKSCDGGYRERSRNCTNSEQGKSTISCDVEGENTQTQTCNTKKCTEICEDKPNIAFVVDSSHSVGKQNFELLKHFVINVTRHFNDTNFAMLRFESQTTEIFNFSLSSTWDRDELERNVMNMSYKLGTTRIDLALKEAANKFFCKICAPSGKKKFLVMITDGANDAGTKSVGEAAEGLKKENVTVMSIGIGRKVKYKELQKIATNEDHVFFIKDFKYLVDKINALVELSCKKEIPRATVPPSIDGKWSPWSPWSLCSKSCGGGYRKRKRNCSNPEPTNGGLPCDLFKDIDRQTQPCNKEECIEICEEKPDIAFVVDSSHSVGRRNFELLKRFVANVTGHFNGTNFALMRFGTLPKIIFNFQTSAKWNRYQLERSIEGMKYKYGTTRIDRALLLAEQQFFCEDCALDENKAKVLFVLTDGANDAGTKKVGDVAKSLKKMGVTIISVGIGRKIKYAELKKIASAEDHVFVIVDFKYLVDKINALVGLSCHKKLSYAHLSE